MSACLLGWNYIRAWRAHADPCCLAHLYKAPQFILFFKYENIYNFNPLTVIFSLFLSYFLFWHLWRPILKVGPSLSSLRAHMNEPMFVLVFSMWPVNCIISAFYYYFLVPDLGNPEGQFIPTCIFSAEVKELTIFIY